MYIPAHTQIEKLFSFHKKLCCQFGHVMKLCCLCLPDDTADNIDQKDSVRSQTYETYDSARIDPATGYETFISSDSNNSSLSNKHKKTLSKGNRLSLTNKRKRTDTNNTTTNSSGQPHKKLSEISSSTRSNTTRTKTPKSTNSDLYISANTHIKHNRIDTNLAQKYYNDILLNKEEEEELVEEDILIQEQEYIEEQRLSIVDSGSDTQTEIEQEQEQQPEQQEQVKHNNNHKNNNMTTTGITNINEPEQMERASTNTIPTTSIIRSSSKIFDEDYIFKYLNGQINSAKSYYDLHNLIHHLLPINELKKILSNQLTKLRDKYKQTNANIYKQTKENINKDKNSSSSKSLKKTDRSTLQQLYLQSASLEEVFSDDILVNIVRFLPSDHYQRIPCISRNFRSIMKKYHTIYQQYTVNVALDNLLLNNDGVLWIVINHSIKSIRIIHRIKNGSSTAVIPRNDSMSIRREFEENVVLNDPNAIKYEIRTEDDITDKVPFLWYHCKKWNIQSMKKIKRRSYFSRDSSQRVPSMNSLGNRSIGGNTQFLGDYTRIRMNNSPLMQDDESSAQNPASPQTPSPYTPDQNVAGVTIPHNSNNSGDPTYHIMINETPTTTTSILGDNSTSMTMTGLPMTGLHHGTSTPIADIMQQQQDDTNLFVAILNKSSNHIESLCIDNIVDKDGSKWTMLNKLKLYKILNHLCINQAIHSNILDSWLNTKAQLSKIKYLELSHLNTINIDKLKQLMINLTNLLVFDCYCNNNMNESGDFYTIKFPASLQFLRLQFVGNSFQIDLSECNNLCALYLNDTYSDSPHLNTIFSNDQHSSNTNNESSEDNKLNGNHSNAASKEIYDNIIWPINGSGIECLLLEQAMDDVHNMNMNTSVPLYINEWYHALKINNSIPVRCVRFITHPFIERKKPMMTKRQSSAASATDDEYDDVPDPPTLMNGAHVRLSASPGPTFLTSNRFTDDNYGDPLKYDRDKTSFIKLEELKKIAFKSYKKSHKNHHYVHDIVKVLDGDEDHLYRGYLWELLLRLKLRAKQDNINNIDSIDNEIDYKKEFEEQLQIYQNWFSIGIGNWIRECGADFHKYNFHQSSLKFLHPYSVSFRNNRSTGW